MEEALRELVKPEKPLLLHIRGEELFVVCVMLAFVLKLFLRLNSVQAYSVAFILFSRPQLVLTGSDNNSNFYELSGALSEISKKYRYAHDTKFVAVQSSRRFVHNDLFGNSLTSTAKLDGLVAFSSSVAELYSKHASIDQVLPVGSAKVHALPEHIRLNSPSNAGVICFLSEFHPTPDNPSQSVVRTSSGRSISFQEYFAVDAIVLSALRDLAIELGFKILIAGRHSRSQLEAEYFARKLAGANYEYRPRTAWHSSYATVLESSLVVTVDSSLGYESLALGRRTLFACIRGFGLLDDHRFAWPKQSREFGPFWLNSWDEDKFKHMLVKLLDQSAEEFFIANQREVSWVMSREPNDRERLIRFLGENLP